MRRRAAARRLCWGQLQTLTAATALPQPGPLRGWLRLAQRRPRSRRRHCRWAHQVAATPAARYHQGAPHLPSHRQQRPRQARRQGHRPVAAPWVRWRPPPQTTAPRTARPLRGPWPRPATDGPRALAVARRAQPPGRCLGARGRRRRCQAALGPRSSAPDGGRHGGSGGGGTRPVRGGCVRQGAGHAVRRCQLTPPPGVRHPGRCPPPKENAAREEEGCGRAVRAELDSGKVAPHRAGGEAPAASRPRWARALGCASLAPATPGLTRGAAPRASGDNKASLGGLSCGEAKILPSARPSSLREALAGPPRSRPGQRGRDSCRRVPANARYAKTAGAGQGWGRQRNKGKGLMMLVLTQAGCRVCGGVCVSGRGGGGDGGQ